MKTTILAALALTSAVSVFAQGTVNVLSYNGQTSHFWGPSPSAPWLSLIGVPYYAYAEAGMTMIGANGTGGKYGAATTFGQLLWGGGSGAASLQPVGPTTTFRTGGAAGLFLGISETISAATSPDSTLQWVVWDNSSGQYATWTQASVAWMAGSIAAGETAPFNVTLGGFGTPPATPPSVWPTSFNLYFLPEPSTFALACLGATALMVFRHRT